MHCPTLHDLPAPPRGKTGWPWTEASLPVPHKTPAGYEWPAISIVTPSFNQGQFLEETIRSVLLQGYPNLQYIIIDGGSGDDSVAIIQKYERWLSHWVSEKDSGQAAALNKGLHLATGKLLGYLNSDDVYCLSGLVALVGSAAPSAPLRRTLVVAPVDDRIGDARGDRHLNSRFGSVHEWLDGGISLHQPGCLWTEDLWHECGPFREDLHYMFDRYFFALARIRGARLIAGNDTLARFRLHPDSKTTRFAFETDQFSAEWNAIKPELQAKLSAPQKLALRFQRHLKENWSLVSRAFARDDGEGGARLLLAKVRHNPLWLLHRPVGSAVLRIGVGKSRLLSRSLKSALGRRQ
jgi:glycosyltransferase involved in cell wall biosynthesis